MSDCLFCQLLAKPELLVYEDAQVGAIKDINPLAPTHLLIIPKKHIASINDTSIEDEPLLGHLFTVAKQLANEQGIGQSGYRTVVNTLDDAGQSVHHLHMHLTGGKDLGPSVN